MEMGERGDLDATDLALLARLAKDGRASLTDLAREVGLSRPLSPTASASWRPAE
ncbi:AsnC family transcriptional regulator [Nonomuraea thailandensis]